MWTKEQLLTAEQRAEMCDSVTLTRDSYLELLDTALSAYRNSILGGVPDTTEATDEMIDAACAAVPDMYRVDAARAIEAALAVMVPNK